jgi:hypothetical protein
MPGRAAHVAAAAIDSNRAFGAVPAVGAVRPPVTDTPEGPPMTTPEPTAPWHELSRDVPAWFRDAKLGIFVHWGAYSVPAWAEPTGELGAVDEDTWFRHNTRTRSGT